MRDDLKSARVFLDLVRRCLAAGDWEGWNRPKNMRFLRAYGLRRQHVCKELEKLVPRHRIQGPMDDDSPGRVSGTVFVFLKPFETETGMLNIYIKLKIPDDDPFCLVISFHEEGCSE